MTKLFFGKRSIMPYLNNCSKHRFNLEQFMEKKTVSDDTWNCVPNSEIHIQYLTPYKKEVGFINYRLSTGQIGLLFITNSEYARKGLGTQMVLRAINEMKKHRITKVWAITRDNHEFWENLPDFKPSQRPHNSVTGSGYEMHLETVS